MPNMRESSRQSWLSDNRTEHINAGSLQRIADATEAMAKNYTDLLNARIEAERQRDYWRKEAERLERQRRSLRGRITVLEKALIKTSLPYKI